MPILMGASSGLQQHLLRPPLFSMERTSPGLDSVLDHNYHRHPAIVEATSADYRCPSRHDSVRYGNTWASWQDWRTSAAVSRRASAATRGRPAGGTSAHTPPAFGNDIGSHVRKKGYRVWGGIPCADGVKGHRSAHGFWLCAVLCCVCGVRALPRLSDTAGTRGWWRRPGPALQRACCRTGSRCCTTLLRWVS